MTRPAPTRPPDRPAPDATIGVAIAIPPPYGTDLADWRARLGDPQARAVPPHITVVPPTRVVADELMVIDEHLRKVAADARSFPIHLRGSGTFRPVSPVVFVALSAGISECELLEARVRSGPLGRPVPFPYHPHVTVAHDLPDAALDRALDMLAAFEARFAVDGFGLFEHECDGVWRLRRRYFCGDK